MDELEIKYIFEHLSGLGTAMMILMAITITNLLLTIIILVN